MRQFFDRMNKMGQDFRPEGRQRQSFPFVAGANFCGYARRFFVGLVGFCSNQGGENCSSGKLEKNGTSPKTWYWAIFKIKKLEMTLRQADSLQNERKRDGKFLQFLENFSGVYPPHRGMATRRARRA